MVTLNRVSLGLGVSRIANGTLQVSAEQFRCGCRRPAKRGCPKPAKTGPRVPRKTERSPHSGLISSFGLV